LIKANAGTAAVETSAVARSGGAADAFDKGKMKQRRYWSYFSNSVSVKVVADKAPDHRQGLLDAQTTFGNGFLGPVEFHQPMWRRRGSNMRRLARQAGAG
jgi:hypothetical protein